jgi:transcriptional regulator with XRE-family HTH domain
MPKHSLTEWIQENLAERGWSQSELARRSNLSSTTISDVLSGSAKPGFNFCKGVAQALGVPTEEVLRKAGLLPPEPEETTTTRELMRSFSQLTVEEQRMVIEMIHGLYERRKRKPTTANASTTA